MKEVFSDWGWMQECGSCGFVPKEQNKYYIIMPFLCPKCGVNGSPPPKIGRIVHEERFFGLWVTFKRIEWKD